GADHRHVDIGAHFRGAVIEAELAELVDEELAPQPVRLVDALRGFRVALRPQAERRRLAAGAPGYPALDHPPQPVLRRRMIAHELGMRLLAHSEPAVEQRIDQVLPVLEVPVETAFGYAEPACQRLDAHALDP